MRAFVVVSGLPGSGKSRLARRMSAPLGLPVLDKDDLLERLFDRMGTGDAAWRRALSRRSDDVLRNEAENSKGAILVSFWHVSGMHADSGTPTDWLNSLSERIVNVHCLCPPEMAARRFTERRRHAGHLDHLRSEADVFESILRLNLFQTPNLPKRIEVDTSLDPDIDRLILQVRATLDLHCVTPRQQPEPQERC